VNPSRLSLENVKENLLSGFRSIIHLVKYVRLFAGRQYRPEEDGRPLYHIDAFARTVNELQHSFLLEK
jgi:hypothetical protein